MIFISLLYYCIFITIIIIVCMYEHSAVEHNSMITA